MKTLKRLHIHENGGAYIYLTKEEVDINNLEENDILQVSDDVK
jgi:hypothetical protein